MSAITFDYVDSQLVVLFDGRPMDTLAQRDAQPTDSGVDVERRDLLIHHMVARANSGQALVAPTLDTLTPTLESFCIAQGLALSSADEMQNNLDLTFRQRAWLRAYCALWEATEDMT